MASPQDPSPSPSPSRPSKWPRSAWLLLAANLVPLVGVLAFGWDLGVVMLLFWAENAVIGVYHVVRLALVARWAGLFLVPFFTLHYGIFTTVHGVFVVTLFVGEADPWALARVIVPGILALVVSHGYSFVTNVLRGGGLGEGKDASALMVAPYRRVVVMHLTILGGGFLLVLLGSPLPALVLLVVLKTAVDLWAHLKEHVRSTPPASAE